MSDALNSTKELFSRLSTPRHHAAVEDYLEEALLEVDKFKRLDYMADRDFALEHNMFSEEAGDVAILCKRSGAACEQTYVFPGVVVYSNLLPFQSYKEISKAEPWSPPGHQYIVLTLMRTKFAALIRRALENFYVMARLRRPEGSLKPFQHLFIDGEEVFCPRTPIATPRARMFADDVPLALNQKQDPRGIMQQYLTQRNQVVLEDNLVQVFTGVKGNKAGNYEPQGDGFGEPGMIRPGHIVNVEVGFRIVPAGRDWTMRVDLKTVIFIRDVLTTELAFAVCDASQDPRNRITVSSTGPSGVHIDGRRTVKRASRLGAGEESNKMDSEGGASTLAQLPYTTSTSTST